MTEKKQRNVIQFAANTPVSLVLDTDPATAKQGQRTTKADKIQYFWTFFVAGESIFFADRDLHGKLQGYKRGDAVIITNVVAPGDKWGSYTVEGTKTAERATSGIEAKVDEILNLVRTIVTQNNVKAAPSVNQNPPSKEEGADIGF